MRVRVAVFAVVCVLIVVSSARAQEHDHHMMTMPENPLGIEHTRDASGTSWLPDVSPMSGAMRHRGPWMVMLHGNLFLQYIEAGSPRGDRQFGSINWGMAMAQREAAGGQIQFRGMVSLEPLTVGKCGYPALLQSGEFCDGEPIHDRQHPHDFLMEAGVSYKRAISDSVAFEVYGGPAGEPALGPTAFPHRFSAMPNPIAPVSHHWLDSSHVSFGVLTGGVYGRKWKAEASAFNGREPDDARWNVDLGALDSFSGRLSILPTAAWAIQVSAGRLKEAEFRTAGERADVTRVTASATYHRLVNSRLWATTVAWGRNREAGHAPSAGHSDVESTSAFTAETAADVTTRDTVFARADVVGKTASELVLPVTGDEVFTVSKFQMGYTRWVAEGFGLRTGVGGSVGLSMLPEGLEPFYGGRSKAELGIFLTVRAR